MAILKLEDLIAAKDRPQVTKTTVYLPGLDGELEIEKIPLPRYMNLISAVSSDDPEGNVAAQYDLIYACCPILHDEQLQEAYECKVPDEIVGKVLQENLGDMNKLLTAINNLYGISLEDELKN